MNLLNASLVRTTAGVRNMAIMLFIACAAFQNPAFAVQLKTLVNFNGMNGLGPEAGLTLDAAGNLYGTTSAGGKGGPGTVFQLIPPVPGQTAWTLKTLVNFNGTNGTWPMAGLVRDAAGHLYGTTYEGGYGFGTVFQLTP